MPPQRRMGNRLSVKSEPTRQSFRIELGLVPDSDPIRGLVRDTSGIAHEFIGWLELIQILEQIRDNSSAERKYLP
jgi:hypothetical protein